MDVDLQALLSLAPGRTDALDWFIGGCLCDGGIWESPRRSEGIQHARDRTRVRRTARLRPHLGRSNPPHVLLELKRDGAGDRFAWTLYFEVIDASTRRAQNTHISHDNPGDIEWRAKLEGEATVQDDKLTIVPGSTRPLVRD